MIIGALVVGLAPAPASADWLFTPFLGANFGGSANFGDFNDNIGIRGDIRYFRSLQDNEPDGEFDLALSDFNFSRGIVGVTFRW